MSTLLAQYLSKLKVRRASGTNPCYLAMPLRRLAMRLHASLCAFSLHALRVSTLTPGKATIALVLLLAMPANAVENRPVPLAATSQPTPPATLLDPKTAKDFNQRGTSKAQNGDLDGAIAAFSQAIQLKRDYAAAYYNRGTAYASTGNVRAALADYTQVISLKPNNAAVRYSRGSLRAKVGDQVGAIADFQQAAALFKQEKNTVFYQKAQATSSSYSSHSHPPSGFENAAWHLKVPKGRALAQNEPE